MNDKEKKQKKESLANNNWCYSSSSIKTRLDRAMDAYKSSGGCRRAYTRAYCSGNKWLEENAKAVGNW